MLPLRTIIMGKDATTIKGEARNAEDSLKRFVNGT